MRTQQIWHFSTQILSASRKKETEIRSGDENKVCKKSDFLLNKQQSQNNTEKYSSNLLFHIIYRVIQALKVK